MRGQKVTTEKFSDNTSIDISVDSSGTFHAEFNDQEFSAPTKQALVEQLVRVVKKATAQRAVDVTVIGLVPTTKRDYGDGPFTTGDGVVHAKLRAKHERQHGTFLLHSNDGKKFSVSNYDRSGVICRPLTDAEVQRYAELRAAIAAAEKAFKEFKDDVSIDPDETLKEARKGDAQPV